jgi:hypothetical protein
LYTKSGLVKVSKINKENNTLDTAFGVNGILDLNQSPGILSENTIVISDKYLYFPTSSYIYAINIDLNIVTHSNFTPPSTSSIFVKQNNFYYLSESSGQIYIYRMDLDLSNKSSIVCISR